MTAGLMVQSLSAQTVDVTASQGATVYYNAADATAADTAGLYQPDSLKTRSNGTMGSGTEYAYKGYIQFDLSSAWATYGEANLTSATLTMFNKNGTGRTFDVWGLLDSSAVRSSLDNWSAATITYNNAPGNTADIYSMNAADAYGSAVLWSANGGGVDETGTYGTTYSQLASYTSPDISTYLKTDTDGLVTLAIIGYNNMAWFNAPWSGQDTSVGEISPALNLTFNGVPEPATMSLLALGLGGLFFVVRRRK